VGDHTDRVRSCFRGEFEQEILEVRNGPVCVVGINRVACQGCLTGPAVANGHTFEWQVDCQLSGPKQSSLKTYVVTMNENQ